MFALVSPAAPARHSPGRGFLRGTRQTMEGADGLVFRRYRFGGIHPSTRALPEGRVPFRRAHPKAATTPIRRNWRWSPVSCCALGLPGKGHSGRGGSANDGPKKGGALRTVAPGDYRTKGQLGASVRSREYRMSDRGEQMNAAAELLEKAQKAANRGDVIEMLEVLTASRYLDGVTRRLQEKWGRSLPWTEIDDCIAQSVDAACAAVTGGRPIRSLGGWLWKSAHNIADDKWRFDHGRRAKLDDTKVRSASETGETDQERESRQELEGLRRKEAIRLARELLPRIGEGQILDVMELVIDAAEDRLPDLPASSIAEALGISKSAARMLVSRGMKRLSRLAEQAGGEAPTGLPELDTDAEEEEDDDAR